MSYLLHENRVQIADESTFSLVYRHQGFSSHVARRGGKAGELAVDKRWKAQSLPALVGGDVERGKIWCGEGTLRGKPLKKASVKGPVV